MVAANILLPNIRKMFVPDPGHVICDADLSGADAQVVAWEAGDERLKEAFRKGMKIHIFNCRDMWPEETASMDDGEIKKSRFYDWAKRGVHGTNYGAKPPTLMENLKWTAARATQFQRRWFELHPDILEWHNRYERFLYGSQCWFCENTDDIVLGKPCPKCKSHLGRTIRNKFGFRRIYFDRVDGLLPQALAWTPQSTVAFSSEIGWTMISQTPDFLKQWGYSEEEMEWMRSLLVNPDAAWKWHNVVKFLVQVHDSIVFQVPKAYEDDVPQIVKDMQVRIPYPDPLVIPLGFGISDKSWGHCE